MAAAPSWVVKARAVAGAPADSRFDDLLRIAGLDAAHDLRFADLSGVSFRDCDLRGFDFTGARLLGCDFTGARIVGARFDQAELDAVRPNGRTDATIASLHAAQDWEAYAKGWRRAAHLSADDHLPVGAVFSDALGIAPEMVVVPAGGFWMGSPEGSGGDQGDAVEPGRYKEEGPRHRVTIAHRLAVGRFAVTFAEWDGAQAHPEWVAASGLSPREPQDEKWGRSRRPVINVSWDDAQAYCHWLAAVTGKPYRLPSEAEWEHCCRAGTETSFWWGASISTSQANYDGNHGYGGGNKGEFREKTTPVDSFGTNPWGLHQVHGNIWEWCQDEWHKSYKGAPDDGSAWQRQATGGRRVIRGGSWSNNPRVLRSASRDGDLAGIRTYNIGIRVVRTLST